MKRMMRISRLVACALTLLILGACHGSTKKTITYVNQKNTAETLTVEERFSAYDRVYNATLDGLQLHSGSYTLKTSSGTTSGTYSRAVRDKVKNDALVFKPAEGKIWGVELRPDGTFENERGIWKQEGVRLEAKVLGKIGG